MPGGDLEPVGHSGPDLAKVTAEMSDVFVLAGWDLPAAGRSRPAVAAPSLARRGGRSAILLTALATGAVGFGAGTFIARAPRTPVVADAKPRAEPQAQPQAQPQAGPQSPPPRQSTAPPPIALAQADPVPTVDAPPATLAATTEPPVHAKPPAKARAQSRVKLQSRDGPRTAAARPPIRVRAASAPVAQPASCERDSRGEDCRRAVLQADLHLQDVYQSAIRRGVSQEVLVDYRSRWAVLRDQKSGDPVRLIEGYGALAYDLRREGAR